MGYILSLLLIPLFFLTGYQGENSFLILTRIVVIYNPRAAIEIEAELIFRGISLELSSVVKKVKRAHINKF